MGKSPCCDKDGLKKGPWTPEEDQKLIEYIHRHGHGRWRILPKNAGLKRCGKSCRLRWTNYLRPDIKRGRFSLEEEEAIIQLHGVLGNKWSAIAAHLPGRTDNEIKNYWNTHIRKRLLRMGIDPVTHTPRMDVLELSSILSSSLYNSSPLHLRPSMLAGGGSIVNPNLLSLVTAFLSSQCRNSDITSQYLQQNLLDNNLVTNQFQASQPIQQNPIYSAQANQLRSPIQEIQHCQTSNTLGTPFQSDQPQNRQAKVEQLTPYLTDLIYENSLSNLWQNNGEHPALSMSAIPSTKLDNIVEPLFENRILQSDSEGSSNFSFGTLISPPSSSATPLNSSSTANYANCGTEEERDSYCSNMFMYDIPNSLNACSGLRM